MLGLHNAKTNSLNFFKNQMMKRLLLLFIAVSFGLSSYAQSEKPQPVTPESLKALKADVEKQIPEFKQKLTNEKLTKTQIEFSVDTFVIERLAAKRMDVDYSTSGMNNAMIAQADSYDKLMNKYYNKLLEKLKKEDKKTLITAQKAWVAYRNAETQLIWAMTKKEYSGGGTIQTNIANASYSDIVVRRTLEIFKYYKAVLGEE